MRTGNYLLLRNQRRWRRRPRREKWPRRGLAGERC